VIEPTTRGHYENPERSMLSPFHRLQGEARTADQHGGFPLLFSPAFLQKHVISFIRRIYLTRGEESHPRLTQAPARTCSCRIAPPPYRDGLYLITRVFSGSRLSYNKSNPGLLQNSIQEMRHILAGLDEPNSVAKSEHRFQLSSGFVARLFAGSRRPR
jgi:hypothetical protein